MIGNDFFLCGGFHEEPLGGIRAATARSWKLDTSNPAATWVENDNMPISIGVTHGGSVVVGQKFYLCGGYLGGHPGPESDRKYSIELWQRFHFAQNLLGILSHF